MQKEIWNKFRLAVEKDCVQQFSDKYLTGNILGTLNNWILKLADALKNIIPNEKAYSYAITLVV